MLNFNKIIKGKIGYLSLLIASVLTSCNNTVISSQLSISSTSSSSSNVSSSEVVTDEGTQIEINFNYIELKNDYLTIQFDKENGSMLALINNETGTDFINNTVGGNWAMTVDNTTNNSYKTNFELNGQVITSRNQIGFYSYQDTIDGIILKYIFDLEFNINGTIYSDVSVTQEIELKDNATSALFRYQIDNYSNKNLVIVNFTGAQISGIKNPEGADPWTLFYPSREGKLYQDAVNRTLNRILNGENAKLQSQYPSPMSMQLLQIYNQEESLYLMVEDSSREYKYLNFGNFTDNKDYDYNALTKEDYVSMSATQFPFIEAGKSKGIFPIKVGICNDESWYGGADEYRAFLISSNMSRDLSDYVSTWNGTSVLIASQYNNSHFASYLPSAYPTTYNRWFYDSKAQGLDATIIIGWHEGGFDSKYPDYDFHTGTGFDGETGFTTMMNEANNNNFGVLPYINGHIADENSNWAKQIYDVSSGKINLLQAAVKSVGFDLNISNNDYYTYMWKQYYGTPTSYYAMCPSSQVFIDALDKAITKLISLGADGIWFDQIMEMPSALCFDPSHGHTSPATAFGEGYKKMFATFETSIAELNVEDFIFLSEGVNDAYVEYIDVNGYMWGRKLGGSTDGNGTPYTPEITRYTIPAKFLGLESYGAISGSSDEYWYAFLHADPFIGAPNKDSTIELINVYKKVPSVFYYGRFMDQIGFSQSDSQIKATMLKSENSNELVLQVYNPNSEISNVNFKIILNELGINGQVVEVEDLFTNQKLSVSNSAFTITTLEAKAIKSYKISYVD